MSDSSAELARLRRDLQEKRRDLQEKLRDLQEKLMESQSLLRSFKANSERIARISRDIYPHLENPGSMPKALAADLRETILEGNALILRVSWLRDGLKGFPFGENFLTQDFLTQDAVTRQELLTRLNELNEQLVDAPIASVPLVRAKGSVPPRAAGFLLDLLLAKADRYAVPGDMEEEFASKLAKYGPAGARLWFWGETGRTIATRNPICRWILVSGLARLVEWIFRQLGS